MAGKKLAGRARSTAEQRIFLRKLVPKIPDIQPPVVPNPPMLPDLPEAEQVRFIAKAYETAMKFYGEKCLYFRGSTIPEKHYKTLKAVIPFIVEFKISPIIWVAFSIEVHQKYVQRGWPSLGWVFSEKRLVERNEWMVWCESKFRGGWYLYGSAHRELLRRFQDMWVDLMGENPQTQARVEQIVDQHLPKRRLRDLVEAAKVDAERIQYEIDKRFMKGEFLWHQQTITDWIRRLRKS